MVFVIASWVVLCFGVYVLLVFWVMCCLIRMVFFGWVGADLAFCLFIFGFCWKFLVLICGGCCFDCVFVGLLVAGGGGGWFGRLAYLWVLAWIWFVGWFSSGWVVRVLLVVAIIDLVPFVGCWRMV